MGASVSLPAWRVNPGEPGPLILGQGPRKRTQDLLLSRFSPQLSVGDALFAHSAAGAAPSGLDDRTSFCVCGAQQVQGKGCPPPAREDERR